MSISTACPWHVILQMQSFDLPFRHAFEYYTIFNTCDECKLTNLEDTLSQETDE